MGCSSSNANNSVKNSTKMQKEDHPEDYPEEPELEHYGLEEGDDESVAPNLKLLNRGFENLPEGYQGIIDSEIDPKKFNFARGRKHKMWSYCQSNQNGDLEEGKKKKGELNGVGRRLTKDGHYYYGKFKDGKLVEGIHVKPDKSFEKGNFDENGNLI